MKMNPEAVLLKRIADQNDEKAFRALYEQYFLDLYQFALSYVKTREFAEEVVSDVFCKIWEARQKLPTISNFRAYMFMSIKNQSITYINQHLKKSEKHMGLDNAFSAELAIDNFTPERKIDVEEFHAQLDAAVQQLPHGCRVAFQLVKGQGMKYKEAAEVLGISVHTVENQVLKALKRLKPLFLENKAETVKKAAGKVIKLASQAIFLLCFLKILMSP